jgi:hypothetical protein
MPQGSVTVLIRNVLQSLSHFLRQSKHLGLHVHAPGPGTRGIPPVYSKSKGLTGDRGILRNHILGLFERCFHLERRDYWP